MAFWSAAQQRPPGPTPQQQFAAAGPSNYQSSFAPAQSQAGGPPPPAQHFGGPAFASAGGGSGSGDGRLRSVDELPACFRAVFPFRYFNAIQNECWPTIFESQINVIIAAPTGGGGPRFVRSTH